MESNDKIPGKGAATASMVLGIISVVLWFFGYSALVSVILGIVGLILAGNAKKAGFVGGIQTAGFVFDWTNRRSHFLRGLHCLRGCYRRNRYFWCPYV